jgi:molecular chaperone DnaK
MGERAVKTFAATGRKMLPEELSAEVLKSLRADVKQFCNEDITAAVIAVPAAFELPRCDATRKAAQLAGFTLSPLVQEPVAAAHAYGFQSMSDRVFWLVYDFGGGTFDTAVIQVRDGLIQVVNHAGDNFLGGKNLDWDIVEKKLVPSLASKYKLTDFRRGVDRWRAAFAHLKAKAEEAKIGVSRTEHPFLISYDSVCADEAGRQVELEYTLTPADLAEIAAPYVTRSIMLCRKALEGARLEPGNIAKIVLVGGTSLLPSLRQALTAELGIPQDCTIDPMTVVARGAAVFAGSQRCPWVSDPTAKYHVDLQYEPLGTDLDPQVGGLVSAGDGSALEGFVIEFVETRSQWRSGRIPLAANGAFMTTVHAERNRRCEFTIGLYDRNGSRHETDPDRFVYTVGLSPGRAIMTHAVGVAQANNVVDVFFNKGDPLPTRGTSCHRTVHAVRRGGAGEVIKIPIVEGEHIARADRNRLIGTLEISAHDPKLRRDVPVGSEVEITIEIDESRIIKSRAFIPIVDDEFEGVFNLVQTPPTVQQLHESFDREIRRLGDQQDKASRIHDPRADKALRRISDEQMVDQVRSLLHAARGDPAEVTQCDNRLLDLKAAIDEVEDALEFPTLVEQARAELSDVKRWVASHGNPDEQGRLRILESELNSAIEARDEDLVKRRKEQIIALGFQVLDRQPGVWVARLEYLEQPAQRAKMRDPAMAEQLYAQGHRAINNNDLEGLKAAVRQLWSLLPPDDEERARGPGRSTIKA